MTEEQQQTAENRQTVLTLNDIWQQMPKRAEMRSINDEIQTLRGQSSTFATYRAISEQVTALAQQFKSTDFATLGLGNSLKSIDFAALGLGNSQLITDWIAEIEQPLRSAAMVFNPNLITDWAAIIEPRRSAPIHLPAMPAPEPTVQAVQSGEAELLHLVGQSLKAGRLSHNDLLALILDSTESKPGQQEAPLDIKLKLNERYESLKAKNGREFTQEIFVRFHAAEIWACSLATFERYRRQIKAFKQSGIL